MTEVKEANPEETTQSQSPGKKAAREGGKRRSFLKPTTGLRMKEVSFMGSYENITSHMVSPLKREAPEFDEGNAKLESDWFVCVTLPPTLDPEVENKKLRCSDESVQSLQPPPHKKSRAVCQNFLRGLCSRGPLCPFRHAVLRPGLSPTVTPEMLSPYSARLAGLVVPKKILERVLASERFELIDMLK